ncbi:hypothetical protein ACWDYH_13310 [Nocardia goodfellowii]
MSSDRAERLMTTRQRELVLAVIGAINSPARPISPYHVERLIEAELTPPPRLSEIAAVLEVLALPEVGFRRGERAGTVLSRVLEVWERSA